MKLCKRCLETKPLDAFYKTCGPCKDCIKAEKRKLYYADLEASRTYERVKYRGSGRYKGRCANGYKQHAT